MMEDDNKTSALGGDYWGKDKILGILLSSHVLLKRNDKAYKSWVLLGADLGIPDTQLKGIKKAAKAKGSGLLHEVVAQLISEWVEEKARKREVATVHELIVALKENDLEAFAEALELEHLSKADAGHRRTSAKSSSTSVAPATTAAENDRQKSEAGLDLSIRSKEKSCDSTVALSLRTTPERDYRALIEEQKKRFALSLSPASRERNASPPENVRRRTYANDDDIDDDTLPSLYRRKLQDDLKRLHERETVKRLRPHNNDKRIDQELSCSRNVGISKQWKRKYQDSSSSGDSQDKRYQRRSFEFSEGRRTSPPRFHGGAGTGSGSGVSGSSTKVNRYHYDTNGLSDLHRAVKDNQREDVIRQIECGADVNEKTLDKHRSTPLHLATWTIPNREDTIEMVKLLINRKAKLDVMNAFNCPFTDGLFHSGGVNQLREITRKQFHDFLKFMIDSDHEKFLRIQWGSSRGCLLSWGMKNGALGRHTLKFLCDKKINLNFKSNGGHNILYYAIWGHRSIGMIQELIDNGVDWRNVCDNNWNLLHAAARFCHPEAFKYFLKREREFASGRAGHGEKTPADFLRMFHPDNKYAAEMLALLKEYRVYV